MQIDDMAEEIKGLLDGWIEGKGDYYGLPLCYEHVTYHADPCSDAGDVHVFNIYTEVLRDIKGYYTILRAMDLEEIGANRLKALLLSISTTGTAQVVINDAESHIETKLLSLTRYLDASLVERLSAYSMRAGLI